MLCDRALGSVHVGARLEHWNRYHLDPKVIADGKVPVITWARAQYFWCTRIASEPRSPETRALCKVDDKIHEGETGVATDQNFLRRHP